MNIICRHVRLPGCSVSVWGPAAGAMLLVALLLAAPSQAAEKLRINIFGPGQTGLNLFFAPSRPIDGQARQMEDPSFVRQMRGFLEKNLGYLPFIDPVPDSDVLGGPDVQSLQGNRIEFKRFRMSQVDVLLTLGWKNDSRALGKVEIRAFDVFSGQLIAGRGYRLTSVDQIDDAANRFCADLMDELTGKSGFFRSQLAFVHKEGGVKEIATCKPQGYNVRRITTYNDVCLSPAWSWDGTRLAFTHVSETRHELGLWDRKQGRLRSILLPGNTLISPTFDPRSGLVISADPQGNPDIYTLNDDYELSRPIIENWGIDISPHFDQSGQKMVFVSSRLGNPHIFLKDMDTGKVRRITFEGTYNTNPSISPDGRFVAFSRMLEAGHRIFVHDLETGRERQVSFGPGNDEDPAWGPDSYFLAFSSNRSGTYKLYLSTRHAHEAKQVSTGPGAATSPAWNPAD